MRGKNDIFLPSFSHAQANSPLLYGLYKLTELYQRNIWLCHLFFPQKETACSCWILAACLSRRTVYAPVEAGCTGDAHQHELGRADIINLSLDVWHFLGGFKKKKNPQFFCFLTLGLSLGIFGSAKLSLLKFWMKTCICVLLSSPQRTAACF